MKFVWRQGFTKFASSSC